MMPRWSKIRWASEECSKSTRNVSFALAFAASSSRRRSLSACTRASSASSSSRFPTASHHRSAGARIQRSMTLLRGRAILQSGRGQKPTTSACLRTMYLSSTVRRPKPGSSNFQCTKPLLSGFCLSLVPAASTSMRSFSISETGTRSVTWIARSCGPRFEIRTFTRCAWVVHAAHRAAVLLGQLDGSLHAHRTVRAPADREVLARRDEQQRAAPDEPTLAHEIHRTGEDRQLRTVHVGALEDHRLRQLRHQHVLGARRRGERHQRHPVGPTVGGHARLARRLELERLAAVVDARQLRRALLRRRAEARGLDLLLARLDHQHLALALR